MHASALSLRVLFAMVSGATLSAGCGGSGPARSQADASSGDAATGAANPDSGTSASDFAQSQSSTDASSQPQSDGGTATTMANPAPGSKFFIGANFWNIDWEGQGDFFVSGVDFATTTNPWLPAFLSDLAPYHVLRFMDWNNINADPNPQADWSTRTQKTAAQSEPVAFEWQIDLCNRTKKDYWLNIPSQASSTYWTQLAQLVHDTLDPSLRVYVEYSNEVWNPTFPQYANAASQAKSLGLAYANGDMGASASFDIYESVRIFEAFEAVFGKGSPRLVKVIAGQSGDTYLFGLKTTALKDSKINPNGTTGDVYAVAPYFNGESIADLTSGVQSEEQATSADVAAAKGTGLTLVAYESGSSSGGNCTTLQIDPGMHDLYVSYLDTQSSAGILGPFMQYTHSGSCWGLKVKTGDAPSAAPKYKGVTDWLAAHP